MRLFQKLKKKTDYKLEKVMIYAKITELKDRYMIYNAVKNERKWEDKKMELDNEELEATKKNREKKADEMFKELGYVFEKETTTHIVYKYIGEKIHYYPIDIQFKKDTKTVIKKINLLDDRTGFNMQELQAINKKVEELGW